MLPLPDNKELKSGRSNYNRGLVWAKFCNKWPNHAPLEQFKGLGGPEKSEWIKKFEGQTLDAEAACTSISNLAAALDGEIRCFTTTSPFITGMGLSSPIENGFLWHHTLGVPYLPGSSIKGMIRAWAEEWEGVKEAKIGRLFGFDAKANAGPAAGNIIVFDALPTKPVKLMAEVITPHDGGWRIAEPTIDKAPSDWVSPVPIPFLAVAPGAEFQFALAPRGGAEPDNLKCAFNYLEEALDWIGAGAKTAVGFGRFGPKALEAGDRVKILKGDHDQKFNGHVGKINKIIQSSPEARAQITPQDDGGKIRGTFALGSLRLYTACASKE